MRPPTMRNSAPEGASATITSLTGSGRALWIGNRTRSRGTTSGAGLGAIPTLKGGLGRQLGRDICAQPLVRCPDAAGGTGGPSFTVAPASCLPPASFPALQADTD